MGFKFFILAFLAVSLPLKAEGDLTPDLMEMLRLVPPSSETGQDFDRRVREIVRRLDPKATEHGLGQVRFLLSADEGIQGFYAPIPSGPILAFSAGLIRRMQNVDGLAAIIAHEWFHHLADSKNSAGQEMAADLFGLKMVADAGFNVNEALKALERQFGTARQVVAQNLNRQYIPGEWFMDIHPLDHNRLKLLQQEEAALSLQRGGFSDIPVTNYAGAFQAAATLPRWRLQTSWMDRMIPPGDWDAASFRIKLAMLSDVVLRLEKFEGKQLADLFERLKTLTPSTDDDRQALTQFTDSVLFPRMATATTAQTIYATLHSRPGGLGTVVGKLKLAANHFTEAKSYSEALSRAEELNKLAEELPSVEVVKQVQKLGLVPSFAFPDVENTARIRKGKGPIVSWQKHTDWAEKEGEGKIFQALLSLGALDHRWKDSRKIERALSRFLALSQGPESRDANFSQLQIDDDGRVVGLKGKSTPYHSVRQGEIPQQVRLKPHWLEPDQIQTQRSLAQKTAARDYREDVYHLLKAAVAGDRTAVEKFHALPFPELNRNSQIPEVLGGGPIGPEFALTHPRFFLEFNRPNLKHLGDSFVLLEELHGPVVSHVLNSEQRKWASVMDQMLREGNAETRSLVKEIFIGKDHLISRERSIITQVDTADREIMADADYDDLLLNPLLKVVLNHTPGVFSLAETLGWSGDSLPFKLHPDISNLFLQAYRPLMGLRNPQSSAEVLFHNVTTALKRPEPFAKGFAIAELYDFYDLWRNPNSEMPLQGVDVDAVLRLLNPKELEGYIALIKLFREGVESKKSWPRSAKGLTDSWLLYHGLDLFPTDGQLESHILKNVLRKASQLKSMEQREEILYRLMQAGKVKSPNLQAQITKTFVEVLKKKYGTDDGSLGYQERIVPRLNEWHRQIPIENKLSFVTQLADELQFQHRLSETVTNLLKEGLRDDSAARSSDIASIFGQVGLEQMRRRPDERSALLKYLAGPRDEAATKEAVRRIRAWEPEVVDKWSNQRVELQHSELEHRAEQVHERFWASPFAARVSLLDELLFPASPMKEERVIDNSPEMLKLAIDLTFPPNERYSENAKEFLNAYLQVVDENQKGLFVGALLGAVEKGRTSREKKTLAGEKLAMILEAMGPAETKLGQAINSHPETPEDIRAGTAQTKQAAAPLLRWELMDLVEKLPPEIKDKVQLVRAPLGSASFYVTVEVALKDGSEAVLRLLRPYSERRSVLGFNRLGRMLGLLQNKLSPRTLQIYRQMISQAEAMAQVETSQELSQEQKQKLDELYHDREIQAGSGKPIKIRTAKILAEGPGAWLMEKAPGVHFNDLPKNTEAQRAVRHEYARALFFHELNNLLRGGHFDTDRHGSQMRIDLKNRTVTHFDAGGVVLTPPTETQKKRLGEVLYQMARHKAQNPEAKIQSVLTDEIQNDQKAGRDISFLLDVQKFLLNTSDFHRDLQSKDLDDIFQSVIRQGEMDSAVAEGFGESFSRASEAEQKLMGESFNRDVTDCLSLTRKLN